MINGSSSNVSAIGYEDGIIQVRFKMDPYTNTSAVVKVYFNLFECIFKGKFVHQYLVHKPQRKIR